jgi:hypothetical protein
MPKLFALLLALFVATACDSEKAAPDAPTQTKETAPETEADIASPEDVAKAYYAAVKAGEFEKAYSLVSKADRAARTLEEYRTVTSNPTQKALNSERTYTVRDAKVEGDTARVFVKMEGPDVPLIQRKMLAEYVNEGKKVPPPDELKGLLQKRFTADDAPQAESRIEVILTREDGEWRLNFDWDQAHPDRAIPQKDRKGTGEAKTKGAEEKSTAE